MKILAALAEPVPIQNINLMMEPAEDRYRSDAADLSDVLSVDIIGLTPSKYPTDELVSAGKAGRHEARTV